MIPRFIVLHCSASSHATPKMIDGWHAARGFHRSDPRAASSWLRHIGYHYVITNGRGATSTEYAAADDGSVIRGRLEDEVGAHCRGLNRRSIGVCLVGHPEKNAPFTDRQLAALDVLCCNLIVAHTLTVDHVIGHYEAPSQAGLPTQERKTCPGINMVSWRERFFVELASFLRARACEPREDRKNDKRDDQG